MSHAFARGSVLRCSLVLLVLAVGSRASAQDKEADPVAKLAKVGPFTANLGTVAQIEVPEGFRFIGKENIKKFNDLTGNLTGANEMGAVLPLAGHWYIIFSYTGEGYVKDDEKDKLDANALLETLRANEVEANKERQRLGMSTLTLVGWEKPPFFDDRTKNLTWALKLQSERTVSINYDSRILGRGGYMSATLVIGPEGWNELIPVYDKLLTGFSYKEGQKYSDWKAGDKVAAVGLTALVAGGAGVLAAKTGILGKLLKPLIVGAVALFGAIGAFFKKLFGRGGAKSSATDESAATE